MIRTIVFATLLALPCSAMAETIADSVADWSTDGTQGANGWTYGYYDQTADGDGTYAASDFQVYAEPDWGWTGNSWDWQGGNVPWTFVNETSGHPNGDNNGAVQYSIRRWESSHDGPATVNWNLAKQNVNCGNGTSLHVYLNGSEIGVSSVEGGDGVGVTGSADVTLASGDVLDIALSSLGPDGSFGDGCDGSHFGANVQAVPEPSTTALLFTSILGLLGLRRRK